MTSQTTLFLYTETLTHAGMGAGIGAVDLPIQREKTTGLPLIQGSGVKGALRQQYGGNKEDIEAVFGPDNEPDYGGAIAVGDARVLAFPVRAVKGVFVWATSYSVLARFIRDCNLTSPPALPAYAPTLFTDNGQAFAEAFVSDTSLMINSQLVLEEYLYAGFVKDKDNNPSQAYKWAEWFGEKALPATDIYTKYYKQQLLKRFVILPDEDFRDFTLYSTEVRTRIKLDREKKTVVDGQLFTEEALPADTLMYIPITTSKPRMPAEKLAKTYFADKQNQTSQAVQRWLKDNSPTRIQVGGDETVGYGFSALRWGA